MTLKWLLVADSIVGRHLRTERARASWVELRFLPLGSSVSHRGPGRALWFLAVPVTSAVAASVSAGLRWEKGRACQSHSQGSREGARGGLCPHRLSLGRQVRLLRPAQG